MTPIKTFARSVALCLLIAAPALLALACKGGETPPAAEGAKPEATTPAAPASDPAAAPAGDAAALPPSHAPTTPPASATPGGAPPAAAPGAPTVPLYPSGPAAQVVAKVNGKTITRGELDFTIKNVVQGNVPPEKHAEVRRDVLNGLIDQELIYQKAVASKVEVSPAEIGASMAQIKKSFPDDKTFAAQLAKDGMTPASIEAMVRHTMVIDKYVKTTVADQVKVSQEDEAKFYAENKEKMKHPEQVRASHVLLRVATGAPPDQKAAQKTKAEEVLSKARGGSDFGALAREYSQDIGSAQRGGDLGYFGKGTMEPSFEQAAFALKSGTISDVVETSYGYHVIKVTDHRAEGYSPIDDVRPRIHEYLAGQRVQGEVQRLTETLRKQAKIETTL